MSQETFQPNPAENGGLSPEQEATAIHFKQQYDDASQARHDREPVGMFKRPNEDFAVWLAGPLLRAHDTVADAQLTHKEKRAKGAATEHFRQNEVAYQVQALREAKAAGVEIKGWTQK